MDRNTRRPDLRFALATSCFRGGLCLRGIKGEVRERLCGCMEQGHEPGSLRPRQAQRNKEGCPRVTSSCCWERQIQTSVFGANRVCFRENGSVRKRVVSSFRTPAGPASGPPWIDLGQIATVEVTSEDPEFPIESVFS